MRYQYISKLNNQKVKSSNSVNTYTSFGMHQIGEIPCLQTSFGREKGGDCDLKSSALTRLNIAGANLKIVNINLFKNGLFQLQLTKPIKLSKYKNLRNNFHAILVRLH